MPRLAGRTIPDAERDRKPACRRGMVDVVEHITDDFLPAFLDRTEAQTAPKPKRLRRRRRSAASMGRPSTRSGRRWTCWQILAGLEGRRLRRGMGEATTGPMLAHCERCQEAQAMQRIGRHPGRDAIPRGAHSTERGFPHPRASDQSGEVTGEGPDTAPLLASDNIMIMDTGDDGGPVCARHAAQLLGEIRLTRYDHRPGPNPPNAENQGIARHASA